MRAMVDGADAKTGAAQTHLHSYVTLIKLVCFSTHPQYTSTACANQLDQ